MATSSTIAIEIDDKDIGRIVVFDMNKTPHSEKYTDREAKIFSTHIKPVEILGKYLVTYCHFDGYIANGVGQELYTHFKDCNTVLNLVLGGEIQYIDRGAAGYYVVTDNNRFRHDYIAPTQTNREPELKFDYAYLFRDGRWLYKDEDDPDTWKELSEYFENT